MTRSDTPVGQALIEGDPVDRQIGLDRNDVDRMIQRQVAIADLGQRSISENDVISLALDAAKTAANSCGADSFSFSECHPNGSDLSCRFGQLVPGTTTTPISEHRIDGGIEETISGYSIRIGQSVTVNDLASDTRFNDALLTNEEVSSGIVCPLLQPKRSFGTLGIYSTSRARFSAMDAVFVESIAHLVAVSFARQSAEALVAEQRVRLDALTEKSDTPTLELTSDAEIKGGNKALEKLSGFKIAELQDRSFFSAFVLPEELDMVRQSIYRLRQSDDRVRFECYVLTKDGTRRRLIWTYTSLKDEHGDVRALMGTGLDVTDQREAVNQLQRAKAAADNALESLRVLREKSADNEKGGSAYHRMRLERRRKERVPFPYKQCVAPILDEVMPSAHMFAEVACHDLSSHGFSFFASKMPDYQRLIVAFGDRGSLIHLTAEIVHITPLEREGEEQYLVGCAYRGRANYGQFSPG